MSLIDDIQAAQVKAAEDVVCANLDKLDLIQPKASEIWWVKFNENISLSKVEIIEITPLTVHLKSKQYTDFAGTRYEKSAVEFIERTK